MDVAISLQLPMSIHTAIGKGIHLPPEHLMKFMNILALTPEVYTASPSKQKAKSIKLMGVHESMRQT